MAINIDTTSTKFQAQENEVKQFAKAYPTKAKAYGLVFGDQLKQEANDAIQDNHKDIKENQKLIKGAPSDKELVEGCKRDINTERQKVQRSRKLISKTNPDFVYYSIKSGAYPNTTATMANNFTDLGPDKPAFVTRKNIVDQRPEGQFTKPDPIVKVFSRSGMKGVNKEQYYLDHKTEIDSKNIQQAKANDQKVDNNNYGSYFNKVLHPDRAKEYGIVSGSDIKNAVSHKINGIKATYFDDLMHNNGKASIESIHNRYNDSVRPYKNIFNRALDYKAYNDTALGNTDKTPNPITRKDLISRQNEKDHVYKKTGMSVPNAVKDTKVFIKSGYLGVDNYHKQQRELNHEKHASVSATQLNHDARQQLKLDRIPKDRSELKELVHITDKAPMFRVNLYDLWHGGFRSRMMDHKHLEQYVHSHPLAKEAMNHKADFDKYNQAKQEEQADAKADSEILSPHEAGSFSAIDSANRHDFYQKAIKPHKKAYDLYNNVIKNHKYNDVIKQHEITKITQRMGKGINLAPKSSGVTKSASSQLSRKPKISQEPRRSRSKSNKRARLIAKKHRRGLHR